MHTCHRCMSILHIYNMCLCVYTMACMSHMHMQCMHTHVEALLCTYMTYVYASGCWILLNMYM